MSELEIKTESCPQHCSVCHQSDGFNPETNYCARCNSPESEIWNDYQVRAEFTQQEKRVVRENEKRFAHLGIRFLSVCAGVIGLFVGVAIGGTLEIYYQADGAAIAGGLICAFLGIACAKGYMAESRPDNQPQDNEPLDEDRPPDHDDNKYAN